MNDDECQRPKRSDVGYGRPPPEHQFKRGQKPHPRKRRRKEKESAQTVLWRILRETRRVEINGEIRWLPTSEVIIRKAYMLSDQGFPTIQRILTAIALAIVDQQEETLPRIETNPDSADAAIRIERRRLG